MSASRLRRLPLSVTVPLVVAVLMAAVGTFVSISVLERLQSNQQAEVERLVDGIGGSLSAALSAHVLQHDVWSTYDLIDRAMAEIETLPPSFIMAIDDNGLILASSSPFDYPVGTAPPAEIVGATDMRDIVLSDGTSLVGRLVPLAQDGRSVGQLAIAFDTGPFVAQRQDVLITLVVVNGALTLLMAGAGYFVVRRMVAPAATFLHRIEEATAGAFQPVPPSTIGAAPHEYAALYQRFNAVVDAARDRERLREQLAHEEKAALMGRLAAAMAHEVNNPLGGLLNTVDTLDRHGARDDVRAESIGILRRGLNGIRDVVGGMLVAWRRDDSDSWLTPAALDDLRALIGPQLRRKGLSLNWDNAITGPLAVPAGSVRQIALNLLINAVNATPVGGTVTFCCVPKAPGFELTVCDDGPGLSDDWCRFLARDDDVLDVPVRGALGLWTVRELVHRLGGTVTTRASPDGTNVIVRLTATEENRRDAA